MMNKFALHFALTMFAMAVGVAQAGHLRSSQQEGIRTRTALTPGERNLATVTTTECGELRDKPYAGRLTLNYEYVVDTFQGVLLDLPSVEDALVQGVVAYLAMCDYDDRPMYAVELTNSHAESSDDSCVPNDNDHMCHVIDGSTTILLDTGVTQAKTLAYDAIKAALADEEYMAEYAPAVASAAFLANGTDAFVVSPSPSSSGGQSSISGPSTTTTIIVAAASVSFVVVSLFAYGMVRRIFPMARSNGLSTPKGKSPGHIGIKAANYYENLDGEQPSLFHLDINNESPSNTWSVSDITSEGSIRSSLSRGTSTLEKIDEETLDEIEMYEADDAEDDDTNRARSPQSVSHFISHFDAIDPRNTSQENGPHESMASFTDLTTSREDYFDEMSAHVTPVVMTPAEAERIIGEFLLSISHNPHDGAVASSPRDEARELRSAEEARGEDNIDVPSSSEEANMSIVDVEEGFDSKGDPETLTSHGDVKEQPLVLSGMAAVKEARLEGDGEDDTDSEGPDCSPIANEHDPTAAKGRTATEGTNSETKTEDTITAPKTLEDVATCSDEANKSILDIEEVCDSKGDLGTPTSVFVSKRDFDTPTSYGDVKEQPLFLSGMAAVKESRLQCDGEEATNSEGPDCAPLPNEHDPTTANGRAATEGANSESKTEDAITPTTLEGADHVSCCGIESVEMQPAADNEADTANDSATGCEESTSTEASTDIESEENEKAPVISPETRNGKESSSSQEAEPVSDALAISTNQRNVVPIQVDSQVTNVCELPRDTNVKEETQTTIERVISVEEPIGLAVGDNSFDDSLAISTYTTESDEQVSLNGWLAHFLHELSADKICASECRTPCHDDQSKAEDQGDSRLS